MFVRPEPDAHLRLARPSRDLTAAEKFWVQGLGLDVLWRSGPGDDVEGGHALLMVGWPQARWHLELVDDADAAATSQQTEEDLLVLYLGEPIAADMEQRLLQAGGRRVPARNPYWQQWGTTFVDPDGYRLVLSHRTWQ